MKVNFKIEMKATIEFLVEIYFRNDLDFFEKYFYSPPLKIRFSVPVERVETSIFNPRVESRCFNPLHSYRQSDSQKSCYEK